MIISNLKGGLGNQLFIYTFIYTLAEKFSTEFCFDLTNYNLKLGKTLEINKLNTNLIECEKSKLKKYRRISMFKFEENIKQRFNLIFSNQNIVKEGQFDLKNFLGKYSNINDYYIDGYWQDIKYFSEKEKYFKSIFKVNYHYLSKNFELLNSEIEYNPKVLAIHIRKNDYLNDINSDIYYNIDLNYYKTAISFIKDKLDIAKIFIFTDDYNWVRKNFNIANSMFIKEYKLTTIEEFEIMKKFKNIIICNSTFSLWASLLNQNKDKLIIAPQNWFNRNNDIITKKLISKEMVVLKN